MTYFKVENLSISFGGIEALRDVHFDVKKGEIYAIIGPNGAGKTTLFNCINGIYKPGKGSIFSRTGKSRESGRIKSPDWGSPAPSRTSSSSPT
jgi:ABC-type branched-subunit amino acid transport system ATPase component